MHTEGKPHADTSSTQLPLSEELDVSATIMDTKHLSCSLLPMIPTLVSSHLMGLLPMTAPFISLAALSISSRLVKRTNPKPLERPVAPSTMTLADRTVLNLSEKTSCSWKSLRYKARARDTAKGRAKRAGE